MKKNSLTASVIAGIVGVAGIGSIADAVNLNPDGLGQVLIYPYYTVQSGNQTLLSIVNTANVAKGVKVRFLEGRNSREVLDFHLYLSEYDVWTATVFAIPEGFEGHPAAGVLTRDRSCTVPTIFGNPGQPTINGTTYIPFVNFAFAGLDHPASAAGTLSSLERTREGYVEVIEMVNLTGAAATAARHGGNGIPANCGALNARWDGGIWANDGGVADTVRPNGQGALFGNAMIVNAAAGTIAGYAADAIEGFSYERLHFPPGDAEPDLSFVNDPNPLSDPSLPATNSQATAYVFEFGRLISATYNTAAPGGFGKIDALSALYASPVVMNEYYLGSSDLVQTDSEWVVTFPTKRYYVDGSPYVNRFNQIVPAFNADAPVAPFGQAFGANGSCAPIRVNVWDREERTPGGSLNFSPPRPGIQNALCWEAQVITFGQGSNITSGDPSEILGSTYFNNIAPPYDAGWARITFGTNIGGIASVPAMRPSAASILDPDITPNKVFRGLPVTGFFVTRFDNGVSGADVLANYSALFRHRTERDCVIQGTDSVCS